MRLLDQRSKNDVSDALCRGRTWPERNDADQHADTAAFYAGGPDIPLTVCVTGRTVMTDSIFIGHRMLMILMASLHLGVICRSSALQPKTFIRCGAGLPSRPGREDKSQQANSHAPQDKHPEHIPRCHRLR